MSVEKRKLEVSESNTGENKKVKLNDDQISKIVDSGEKNKIDEEFESHFEKYPNDGDAWTIYIEWMINNPDKYERKDIDLSFSKVLTKIYHIGLWRLYLRYVQMNHSITGDDEEKSRSIVLKAFKFATDTVGIDYFEGDLIWTDYLKYLSEWNPSNPNEVETRESLIRKALRTMISFPSKKLSEHWKSFTQFESNIDVMKSRKVISDASIEIAKIRKLNNELEKIIGGIVKMRERKYSVRQVNKWEKWIEWEKKNLMELNNDELNKRINYVYNQSIQYGRFMPQLWFNYANYLSENDKKLECINLLREGLKVNPFSFILTNGLSERYEIEGEGKIEELKNVWIELIENVIREGNEDKDNIVSFCYCELMRIVNRINGFKEVRPIFKRARQYKGIKWNVYYDYSMIEYNNGENKIANRSFQLGMQIFKDDIKFVMKYLEFLIISKDMVTFKNVIEKSIEFFFENGDLNGLKRIMSKYYDIETQFGDIKLINKLCEKYDSIFGKMKHLELLVSKMEEFGPQFNIIKELDEYKGKKEKEKGEKEKGEKGEKGGKSEKIEIEVEDEEEEEDYTPEVTAVVVNDTAADGGNGTLEGVMDALQKDQTGGETGEAGEAGV
ncbi:hypothetical protein CANINC_004310 [Pichia inconspicua]|uniref:mRNA 3'-end-processing protein RNA14 n=1 Tax=Pichia inconspicua TaxID=52247 RepID=A0A4T0WWU7_9ASCO|nr:hypothetical protein CANINC_004310 [[Candida] inconspicua]